MRYPKSICVDFLLDISPLSVWFSFPLPVSYAGKSYSLCYAPQISPPWLFRQFSCNLANPRGKRFVLSSFSNMTNLSVAKKSIFYYMHLNYE